MPRTARLRSPLAATVLLAALAACGGGGADPTGSGSGAPAPGPVPGDVTTTVVDGGPSDDVALPAALDFSAPTVDGGRLEGASLAGEDVVLWFWAPW